MSPIRYLLPAGVAASGIAVAQLHGVGFWIGLFGAPVLGWAVSLTWEAASVWLWWRGDRTWPHRLAKWAATAALVAGMVVQSAGPLLTRAADADAGRVVLEILAGQTAAGHWISQTTLKRALATTTAGAGTILAGLPPWALHAIAGATVALMPALYALALLAVVTIGREWRGTGPAPARSPGPGERSAAGAEGRERPERAALRAYARRHGLTSQRAVADAIGERPSALSEWANGKLGGEAAARIAQALER
jgi:hypothetical protein